jgi:hypothetical protein
MAVTTLARHPPTRTHPSIHADFGSSSLPPVTLAPQLLYVVARRKSKVLRITIDETDLAIAMTLEGRIAGPWVNELHQAWTQITPKLGRRTMSVDLSNVTYADASGKQILRNICAQSSAKLVANNLWARYIAEEITKESQEEHGHASNA